MPRLSANLTMLFTEVPFADRFAAARRAGFDAVEFVSPYEHEPRVLLDLLRTHRLEVSVFNLPAGNWAAGDRGMACDPSRVGEFRFGVDRAVEYALALGCPRVHAMAGIRPAGVPEDALRATYLENLRFAAGVLDRHGLGLLVEAINDRDMPGYYLTTSRQAFDVIDALRLPNLAFQADVYHLEIMEGDPARIIEEHAARVGHVQIADVPGRHEPGTGRIDFHHLFHVLDRCGYQGWVGCEYRPLGTTEAGLSWREELA